MAMPTSPNYAPPEILDMASVSLIMDVLTKATMAAPANARKRVMFSVFAISDLYSKSFTTRFCS